MPSWGAGQSLPRLTHISVLIDLLPLHLTRMAERMDDNDPDRSGEESGEVNDSDMEIPDNRDLQTSAASDPGNPGECTPGARRESAGSSRRSSSAKSDKADEPKADKPPRRSRSTTPRSNANKDRSSDTKDPQNKATVSVFMANVKNRANDAKFKCHDARIDRVEIPLNIPDKCAIQIGNETSIYRSFNTTRYDDGFILIRKERRRSGVRRTGGAPVRREPPRRLFDGSHRAETPRIADLDEFPELAGIAESTESGKNADSTESTESTKYRQKSFLAETIGDSRSGKKPDCAHCTECTKNRGKMDFPVTYAYAVADVNLNNNAKDDEKREQPKTQQNSAKGGKAEQQPNKPSTSIKGYFVKNTSRTMVQSSNFKSDRVRKTKSETKNTVKTPVNFADNVDDTDSSATLVPSDISTRHLATPVRRLDNLDSLDELSLSRVFRVSETSSNKLSEPVSGKEPSSRKRNLSSINSDLETTSKKHLPERIENVQSSGPLAMSTQSDSAIQMSRDMMELNCVSVIDIDESDSDSPSDSITEDTLRNLEDLLNVDSGSDIEIDLNMDFSCLFQDGTRKKVDIPPEAHRAFREARDDLNEEARKRAYAGHLSSMCDADVVPRYMMGMTDRYPEWLPQEDSFRSKFYNMEREHAKDRMRSLAKILNEEANEDADNAQANLKKLRHKMKGKPEAFKESKGLMASQVARKKKARSRSLEEKEIKEHREQPTFDTFARDKLPKKTDKNKPDPGRPLVFVPEPLQPLTEAQKEEIRKARNRRKNLKSRERIRQREEERRLRRENSDNKRKSSAKKDDGPAKKARRPADEAQTRNRRGNNRQKTAKADDNYPTVNGVVEDGQVAGPSGYGPGGSGASAPKSDERDFQRRVVTGLKRTIPVEAPATGGDSKPLKKKKSKKSKGKSTQRQTADQRAMMSRLLEVALSKALQSINLSEEEEEEEED